jgi:hypothetical protein
MKYLEQDYIIGCSKVIILFIKIYHCMKIIKLFLILKKKVSIKPPRILIFKKTVAYSFNYHLSLP